MILFSQCDALKCLTTTTPTTPLQNVIKCYSFWFQKVEPLTIVYMSVSRYETIQHTDQSHHKILVYCIL